MKQEIFAFRVRQALNEGAAHIDYKSQLRLQKARETALARLKPSPLLGQHRLTERHLNHTPVVLRAATDRVCSPATSSRRSAASRLRAAL